ncbi:MAG: PIG-L family deacetylase [Chloroflexota bacterium]|nr:PIG-L family deacetylase [Chloroflexota bacterium]
MTHGSAGRRLLVTTAHPDDESFGPGGTLAKYAREGAQVFLICATRGEAGGSDLADVGDCEDLACRREQELRCAVKVLGVTELFQLGYRDSGMAGSQTNQHPRSLFQANVDEVARRVADVIVQTRPQVILTSDPYGGYGHPDHIAIHRATLRAWEMVQAGLLPQAERPQRLYYSTFSHTMLRWAARVMPLLGRNPRALGANHDIDLLEILSHTIPITTRISFGPYYDIAQQASACHSSQLSGPSSVLGWMPRWLQRRLRSTDTFYRAYPTMGHNEMIERDLFAGVSA